jgi:hypothetical protein
VEAAVVEAAMEAVVAVAVEEDTKCKKIELV